MQRVVEGDAGAGRFSHEDAYKLSKTILRLSMLGGALLFLYLWFGRDMNFFLAAVISIGATWAGAGTILSVIFRKSRSSKKSFDFPRRQERAVQSPEMMADDLRSIRNYPSPGTPGDNTSVGGFPPGCDFELARGEIAEFFLIHGKRAIGQDKVLMTTPEFTAAWEVFDHNPYASTASELVRISPVLRRYFEACSPSGTLYKDELLRKVLSSAETRILTRDRCGQKLRIQSGRGRVKAKCPVLRVYFFA